MELKVSSPKSGYFSSSDCATDPEEKEISDDDDDRNHKHRRTEFRSETLEGDTSEPFISKPFRKWNRPFGNRHHIRDDESEASETLKPYNVSAGEKEFSSKFDRRRTGLATFPRTSSDINQRMHGNQFFSGEHAISRGRGRDSGSWNQRDPRFNTVDFAAQLVHQGSVPPSIYTGRGLPNISNAQSASWNGFRFIPGIPNGDMLHSVNLQASLRPPINASLSIGIPRHRCRDFEERGFCLRGDMCPMEHGVNRIVVEDVQSLSQFNLPVSLPSGHQLGTSAGLGPPQPGNASTTSMNVKCIMGKVNKTGINDDDMVMNGASPSDFYYPDQPLWNDHGPETSNALLSLQSPGIDEPVSLTTEAPSCQLHVRVRDVAKSDCQIGSMCTSDATQHASSSVWARINAPKNKFDKNINSITSTFQYQETKIKEGKDEVVGVQAASNQGNRVNVEDTRSNPLDKPSKNQSDKKWNIRKSYQKAQRTLFVSGVPQKSNKTEALLSHFQKFGEVIGIHIPVNSERAFVQFSKREEAEAALQAPDAVMGNRFIKLWWANRDSIPDDGASNINGASIIPHGIVPSHPIVAGRGRDVHHSSPLKGVTDMITGPDHPKSVLSNGPNVPSNSQKKLENLEQLKEEIRKKQEMLDRKRTDFRRQLDKLERQASGLKVEMVSVQAAKSLNVGPADGAKPVYPRSSDSKSAVPSPHAEAFADKEKSVENIEPYCPKTSTTIVAQKTTTLKEAVNLLPMDKHKSEKPCIAFRIIPPLPEGLANDAVLKDHFSSYGDLSGIELENLETDGGGNQSKRLLNCSACIGFTTHLAAERAFNEGACWRGNDLKFVWLASSSPNNTPVNEGKASSSAAPSDLGFAATEELACETMGSTVCECEPENSQVKSDSEQS